jgi:hypothetical protein
VVRGFNLQKSHLTQREKTLMGQQILMVQIFPAAHLTEDPTLPNQFPMHKLFLNLLMNYK